MSPVEFAACLLAYCHATRGSVSSWGRTQIHNARVGGVQNSYHRTWCAADVVYDYVPPPLEEVRALASHLGLEIIREDSHDHLEPKG